MSPREIRLRSLKHSLEMVLVEWGPKMKVRGANGMVECSEALKVTRRELRKDRKRLK